MTEKKQDKGEEKGSGEKKRKEQAEGREGKTAGDRGRDGEPERGRRTG